MRGVKSGYPFTVALGLVWEEMSDPIGTEFGMTSDEVSFGSDIGGALDNLFHRVGDEDLLYLIMSLKIQNETGGNLAEILSRGSTASRTRNPPAQSAGGFCRRPSLWRVSHSDAFLALYHYQLYEA